MKKEIRVVVIIFSIGFFSIVHVIVHDPGIKKEPHIDPPPYSHQYEVPSTFIPGSAERTSTWD